MLPFKLIYSDDYYLPIGAHVFPAEKYRRIHDRLLETGIAEPSDFLTPRPASDEDILLVHTPEYVRKLKTGTLSAHEELEMEIPFSPELVHAFWLAAGGSILAADYALRDHLAFNVDCDVHQGNGTAAIFAGVHVASEPLPSGSASTLNWLRPSKARNDRVGDVF